MFRCYSYTIIRERINLCLLKLQLLKQSILIGSFTAETCSPDIIDISSMYWYTYVVF